MAPANLATMNRRALPSLLLLLAAGACTDGGYRGDAMISPDAGTDELPTFDWCSTGPDNCWKASLAALEACTPGRDDFGTLDADGVSCTYADGSTTRFASSVIPYDPNDVDATLQQDGAFCARVVRDGLGLQVETSLGVLTLEVDAAARRAEVSCPDGRRYRLTGTPSCGMDPDDWPFVVTERAGPGEAGLDLGGGPSGAVPVFACFTE